MSRPARMSFPSTQRRAEGLGERIRAARIRRGMPATEMAARVLVSRPTIRRLEVGDMNVSLAILARVLEILGMDKDLDLIAVEDTLGHQLVDARLPRPRRSSERTLADSL